MNFVEVENNDSDSNLEDLVGEDGHMGLNLMTILREETMKV